MKRTFAKFAVGRVAGGLAVGMASGAAQAAGGPTDQDILKDAETPGDILTYGMGTQGQRHSTLKAVNPDTVKKLAPVWAFSFGGEKQRGQESQPIVYDGTIYVTGSYSRLFAIDARTGEKKWQYDARLPEGIMPCCDVVNRGAAIRGDKIYFGTLDARLVALNKDTGKVVWNKKVADYQAGYSMTAAPLIVDGKIITGNSGGEFGVVGAVEARDAETGELVWTRPTVEGNMGTLNGKDSTMTGTKNASWPGDLWQTGGGATWLGGTYDPETKSLFFGTGNPAPWNSHLRPGDNLYTSSTLAINPDNGEIKWHFQTTPHDGWDFDGVNEFISFDLKKDGKTIKAGAKADRNGFFFVIDRTNGKLLNATPFVTETSWAKGFDLNTGKPIYNEDKRPPNPVDGGGASAGQGKPIFAAPSFLGGKNWMPMAYSPDTELFYVPANEWGMDIWNEAITYKKGAAYPGRRLHHQAAVRGLYRRSPRDRSEDRQDRVGIQEPRSALGRRADHRRQPRLHRHSGRLPEGLRRQDRRRALEVQHRLRHRRLPRHLGNGRRAVCFRRFRLGWRRPAVGWRSRQEGQGHQPGRHALDLQAAEDLSLRLVSYR